MVLALVLVAGCGKDDDHGPGFGIGDGGGTVTSTGDGGSGGLFSTGGGGDGGGPVCAHFCEPGAPAWFEDLTMFWIGPPEEAPPCPDIAPLEGSIGYADLHVAPHTCPMCSCSPAACALPEAMHASAAKCPADGAPSIAWDATPAWEGVCSAEAPIAAGLACAGVPCVQSLTIAAPTVEPCKPSAPVDPSSFPPTSWGTIARECMIGPLSGEGCSTGEACVPAPPEGFTLCVYRYGDHPALECPKEYPRRVDVFTGIQDERACEPCACGTPDGECAALVSVYSDGVCGSLLAAGTPTTGEPACVDLPSGAALGSKEAVLTVDQAGNCESSGGRAMGAAKPVDPVVLCCLPDPVPAD